MLADCKYPYYYNNMVIVNHYVVFLYDNMRDYSTLVIIIMKQACAKNHTRRLINGMRVPTIPSKSII